MAYIMARASHKKTLFMIAISAVILIGIIYLISQVTVMGGFEDLEEKFVQRNIIRSREVLKDRINGLGIKLVDWSSWDDTYAFIEDKNEEYIKSNLNGTSLANLGIDLIVYYDPRGEIAYAVGYDPDRKERTQLPGDIKSFLEKEKLLNRHAEKTGLASGIVMFSKGPAMMFSRPILTSDANGPIRGALLFGTFLDAEEIKRLGDVIHVDLDAQRIDTVALPPDFNNAREAFLKGRETFAEENGAKAISGYSVIKDIYGRPALILKAESPREITQFGRQTLLYFIIALIAAGFVFGTAVYLPLYREISGRQLAEDRLIKLNESFLAFGPDPAANINTLTALCGEVLGCALAVYGRVENGIFYTLGAAWRVPAEFKGLKDPEKTICVAAIEGKQLATTVIRHLENTKYAVPGSIIAENNMRTCMRTAIKRNKDFVGSLCAFYKEDREPNEYDKNIISIIAAAIGVEENRLFKDKELKESEERFRNMADITEEFIWEIDKNGLFTYANAVSEKVLGYKAEEIVGNKHFYDFFAPEGKEELTRKAFEVIAKRQSFREIANVNIHRSGREVILSTTGRPVFDARGELKGYRGVDVDITERREAEKERERMVLLRQSINTFQQALLVPGTAEEKAKRVTDGIVRLFNVDFCRIWVIKPGDMCRKGCIHAETPAGPHACRDRDKCLHLLASSGRYTHIDGKVHGRVPLGSYKIGRLASGEEHGFLTNDVQNDPRIHSNRWARELGLISFGGYRMKASDGKTLGVLAFFAKQPVPEDEGAMIDGISSSAALAIQQADTEKTLREALKNLQDTQEQLIQTGKLASIGQLAAGIAHEINNPLGFILSNTETLHTYMKELTAIFRGREDLKRSISDKGTEKTGSPEPPLSEIEEGSDVKYVLNDIESILKESTEGLERIKKIVMDLKVFARKEEEAKSPVNLNDLLDGVINIVWNEIKYKAELKKDYGQIPQVLCRSQRMGQVFINLFINAVQAIERSGTISVRTYSDAKQVYVEISDTGKGIPEENMSKIFEPFFTTREDGKGTGLGLSISYDIVKAHNGTITVESMVGKGSKFTVSLPV